MKSWLIGIALLHLVGCGAPIETRRTVSTHLEQPDLAGRVQAMRGYLHPPSEVLDLYYRVETSDSNHPLDSPACRVEAVYRVAPGDVDRWRKAFEKTGYSKNSLSTAGLKAFLATTPFKPKQAATVLSQGNHQVALYPQDGLIQVHAGHTAVSPVFLRP